MNEKRICQFLMLSFLTLFVSSASAAQPAARITSDGSFRIDDVRITVPGVRNWPLVDGDEVVLEKGSGKLELPDGTRIYILPNTQFIVTTAEKRTAIQLRAGGLQYHFTRNSMVDLSALEHKPVPEGTTDGRLLIDGGEAYWYPFEEEIRRQFARLNRVVEESEFVNARITPYNLDYIDGWRQFNPEWGNPPGSGIPSGPVPPAAELDPPEPIPVSNYYPGERTSP